MPPEPPEPRPRPLGQIRFYVDEDILGIGYALMWAYPDTVTVEAEARIVGFAGSSGNMNSWQMVSALARHWNAIENQIAKELSDP